MLESHPDLVLLAIEGILAETIDIIAKNKEQVREFGQNVQEIYKILSKKEEEALTEIEQEIKLQTIELGQEIDEFVGSEGG